MYFRLFIYYLRFLSLVSWSVWINDAHQINCQVPFGGYKQSGLGREWGREGLEDFLETKTVSFPV